MGKKSRFMLRTSTRALLEVFQEFHAALVKEIFSQKQNHVLLEINSKELDRIDLLAQNIITKIIQIRFLEDLRFLPDKPLIHLYVTWNTKTSNGSLTNSLFTLIKQNLQPYGLWKKEDEILIRIHISEFVLQDILEELTRIVCNEFFTDSIIDIAESYLAFSSVITNGRLMYKPNRRDQQKIGAFYSPPSLVDWIVKQNMSRLIKQQLSSFPHKIRRISTKDLNLSILDPTCGAGVFLYYTQKYLAQELKIQIQNKVISLDRNGPEITLNRLILKNLYGVDINPRAVNFTQFILAIHYLLLESSDSQNVSTVNLGNIFCGDFLQIPIRKDRGSISWAEKARSVFEDPKRSKGFALIMGNPPFISEVRKNKDIFRKLKQIPHLAPFYEQKMDIAYFFIERAIQLLSKNEYNKLVMFLPAYWISRSHTKRFHEFLINETQILSLHEFGHLKLFDYAKGHHTSLLTLTRRSIPYPYQSLRITIPRTQDSVDEVVASLQKEDGRRYKQEKVIVDYDPREKSISILSSQEKSIQEVIQRFPPSQRISLNVTQGLIVPNERIPRKKTVSKISTVTPQDRGIFVLTPKEIQQLNLTPQEKEFIQPFFYPYQIGAFWFDPHPNFFLLYIGKEEILKIEQTPDAFPNIQKHLLSLDHYITSDNKPFGLHRPRKKQWFTDPRKVLIVRKSRTPHAVTIAEPYFMNQGVILITPPEGISPHYLVGLLNSKLIHYWFQSQKTQGANLQIDIEVIRKLPIPNPPEVFHTTITKLTRQIMQYVQNRKPTTDYLLMETTLPQPLLKLWIELNKLVYKLYNISKNDIRYVESKLK